MFISKLDLLKSIGIPLLIKMSYKLTISDNQGFESNIFLLGEALLNKPWDKTLCFLVILSCKGHVARRAAVSGGLWGVYGVTFPG